jgi:hypothetical protein
MRRCGSIPSFSLFARVTAHPIGVGVVRRLVDEIEALHRARGAWSDVEQCAVGLGVGSTEGRCHRERITPRERGFASTLSSSSLNAMRVTSSPD